MRPIISSQKHYVQMSRSEVMSGSLNVEVLVEARKLADVAGVDEVREGAVVKAVYIELWLVASLDDQSFIITVQKSPDDTFSTFADITALGTYHNKKNVLYTTMGLSPGDNGGSPNAIIRQWIKIPKSKQRFGLGDRFHLNIASQGANSIFYCGFATYKEYT